MNTELRNTVKTQISAQNFKEACIQALQKVGCRITKPRMAVIECLSKAKTPLSAPALFEKLSSRSNKGTPPDKVSVYRALETLLELNLIHKVAPHGEYLACSHQECLHSHHIMSRCIECNEVQELDVPSEVVAPLLFHMENSLHFTPDSHLLHMDGLCSSCAHR